MRRRDNLRRHCARSFGHEYAASVNVRSLRCATILLALLLATSSAIGATPNQATSSRAAREDAARNIPFDKLDPQMKDRVASTISHASLYRRLPIQVTDCDPDLYLFLVRHPEVVVNIWEVMKISNVAITRTGTDTFRASDGVGTLCNIKFCYSSHDTHVIYAEGSYDGPLFNKPIEAKCVLLLKSGYMQETNGRHFVTSRMDTFIQIENSGVELLAKTLQLLVHRSADYNFVETAAFVGTISRAAELNSPGVCRLASKLSNCEPTDRERFAELARDVNRKADDRDAIHASAITPATRTDRRAVPARR